jgi:hypothetical protein
VESELIRTLVFDGLKLAKFCGIGTYENPGF